MISKRKLMKYRKEALQHQDMQEAVDYPILGQRALSDAYIKKVLELTQELIDQKLINE